MPTTRDSCLTHRTWYTSAAAPDAKRRAASIRTPMPADTLPRTPGAAAPTPRARGRGRWLAGAAAAGGFKFAHHLIDAEAGGLLPWWKLLEALDPLPDEELGRHEEEPPTDLPVPIVLGFVLGL